MQGIIVLIIIGIVMYKIFNGMPSKGDSSADHIHIGEYSDNYAMDEMQRQQNQEFTDWSLDESMKSVTPFEHGGYDMEQGNSFNDNNMGGF